jgi:hypothetical protein
MNDDRDRFDALNLKHALELIGEELARMAKRADADDAPARKAIWRARLDLRRIHAACAMRNAPAAAYRALMLAVALADLDLDLNRVLRAHRKFVEEAKHHGANNNAARAAKAKQRHKQMVAAYNKALAAGADPREAAAAICERFECSRRTLRRAIIKKM